MQVELDAALEILPLLSPTQLRIVTIILREYRDGEPWATMTAAELARGAELLSSNMYRALKPLRDARIVLRPSSTVWQVNPHIGWRGSRKQWEAARKQTDYPNLEALNG